MCIDRALGGARTQRAFDAAITERADNLSVRPLFKPRPQGIWAPRAAIYVAKRWAPGQRLEVAFLDGSARLHGAVAAVAAEWEAVANVRFAFGRHSRPDLRVSFGADSGSWSFVGTDARLVPQSQPTINFGWLTDATPELELRRVVLHEFGHVLGLVHEHQSPGSLGHIPWDKDAVLNYYKQFGWSHRDVEQNVLQPYSFEQTNFTAFDRSSIMVYPIDDRLTVGRYSVGWNRELSKADRDFIRSAYAPPPQPVDVVVGGPRIAGTLTRDAEVDVFSFVATDEKRHVVDTHGTSDTFVTLLGPDDPSAVLAIDDDRGQRRNARIVRRLRPGRYWIRVRHGVIDGRGPYTLGVRAYR
jgi:hypothetical protein